MKCISKQKFTQLLTPEHRQNCLTSFTNPDSSAPGFSTTPARWNDLTRFIARHEAQKPESNEHQPHPHALRVSRESTGRRCPPTVLELGREISTARVAADVLSDSRRGGQKKNSRQPRPACGIPARSCHWALGSVEKWVWRHLAGINPDEDQPGFAHMAIRPRPGQKIDWVKASYESVRGKITVEWQLEMADSR